jgi:hypothetical protein
MPPVNVNDSPIMQVLNVGREKFTALRKEFSDGPDADHLDDMIGIYKKAPEILIEIAGSGISVFRHTRFAYTLHSNKKMQDKIDTETFKTPSFNSLQYKLADTFLSLYHILHQVAPDLKFHSMAPFLDKEKLRHKLIVIVAGWFGAENMLNGFFSNNDAQVIRPTIATLIKKYVGIKLKHDGSQQDYNDFMSKGYTDDQVFAFLGKCSAEIMELVKPTPLVASTPASTSSTTVDTSDDSVLIEDEVRVGHNAALLPGSTTTLVVAATAAENLSESHNEDADVVLDAVTPTALQSLQMEYQNIRARIAAYEAIEAIEYIDGLDIAIDKIKELFPKQDMPGLETYESFTNNLVGISHNMNELLRIWQERSSLVLSITPNNIDKIKSRISLLEVPINKSRTLVRESLGNLQKSLTPLKKSAVDRARLITIQIVKLQPSEPNFTAILTLNLQLGQLANSIPSTASPETTDSVHTLQQKIDEFVFEHSQTAKTAEECTAFKAEFHATLKTQAALMNSTDVQLKLHVLNLSLSLDDKPAVRQQIIDAVKTQPVETCTSQVRVLQNLYKAINNMDEYGQSLPPDRRYNARLGVDKVVEALEDQLDAFVVKHSITPATQAEIKAFDTAFKDIVKGQDQILGQHDAKWKLIIANVLLALAAVVTFSGVYHWRKNKTASETGQARFFLPLTTNRQKLLEKIEKVENELPLLA